MGKNNNKIADKIASRTKEAYLMLKVPVGYSLMRNTRALLLNQMGTDATDEDLEEIFARFLDLVIFGLMRDSNQIGSSFPSPEHFYEVVKEVMEQKQAEQNDGDFSYDEFRFDDNGDQGQGEEQMMAPQQPQVVDPRMKQKRPGRY